MADPVQAVGGLCAARFNRTVPCAGEFVPSEGCCLRHACLFDIWIADHEGWRVYAFNPDGLPNPTVGRMNPEQLRRWKRQKFHAWLDKIGLARALQALKS